MNDAKISKHIRDLVRRANSTDSPNEREISAVEAARLIEKHDITIGDKSFTEDAQVRKPKIPKPTPTKTPSYRTRQKSTWTPPVPASYPQWEETRAPSDGFCLECQGPYYQGELVWFKQGLGYIHEEIACSSPGRNW